MSSNQSIDSSGHESSVDGVSKRLRDRRSRSPRRGRRRQFRSLPSRGLLIRFGVGGHRRPAKTRLSDPLQPGPSSGYVDGDMRRWLALAGWLAFVGASIAGLHRLGDWFPLRLVLDPGGPLEPALAAGLRLVGLAGRLLVGRVDGSLPDRPGGPGAGGDPVGAVGNDRSGATSDRRHRGRRAGGHDWPSGQRRRNDRSRIRARSRRRSRRAPRSGRPRMTRPASDPGPSAPRIRRTSHPLPPTRIRDGQPGRAGAIRRRIEVVVRSGDHMWSLAEQRLTSVRGRAVSDSEIALYWLKVIAANLLEDQIGRSRPHLPRRDPVPARHRPLTVIERS